MKAAIFTFVALAVKLGSASADGNLQPKVLGFNLQNVQDKREILIHLTIFKIGYE